MNTRLSTRLRELAGSLRRRWSVGYGATSYSQEGEDMILRRLFERQRNGFYVDVGAHHPHRFSNTFYFYERGWRGINVEPNPDAVRAFKRHRRRDANLECGVGPVASIQKYFRINEPALNTFDERVANSYSSPYRIIDILHVPTRRLDEILRDNVPPGVAISFLSVDVEGQDLSVLQSNDWELFRPKCVLVEVDSGDIPAILRHPVHRLMEDHGYDLFAKTVKTVFYLERGGKTTAESQGL